MGLIPTRKRSAHFDDWQPRVRPGRGIMRQRCQTPGQIPSSQPGAARSDFRIDEPVRDGGSFRRACEGSRRSVRAEQQPRSRRREQTFLRRSDLSTRLLDSGNPATDQIASLTKFETLQAGKPNTVDCAIARRRALPLSQTRFYLLARHKGRRPPRLTWPCTSSDAPPDTPSAKSPA